MQVLRLHDGSLHLDLQQGFRRPESVLSPSPTGRAGEVFVQEIEWLSLFLASRYNDGRLPHEALLPGPLNGLPAELAAAKESATHTLRFSRNDEDVGKARALVDALASADGWPHDEGRDFLINLRKALEEWLNESD